MKLDCHNGWFKGLGDIVCFAWIGQALLDQNKHIEFYAEGWRADVLRMFQMPVTSDSRDALLITTGYEIAVDAKSPLSYIEWIAEHMGARTEGEKCYERPRANIMPMDREMGRKAAADVLVFPEGVWQPRVWPKYFYLELVLMLKQAGINVKVVTQERDESFGFVHCIYKKSLEFVAAAMQKARLVIGNDSGPAHLAGTLGTRVLAIHGPTTERIYSYLPEVTSLRKVSLGCAGCHGRVASAGSDIFRGWRNLTCPFGCEELYRTMPEDVFERAIVMLGSTINRQEAA